MIVPANYTIAAADRKTRALLVRSPSTAGPAHRPEEPVLDTQHRRFTAIQHRRFTAVHS